MKFESSEKIRTTRSKEDLMNSLEEQLKKVSGKVKRVGDTLIATKMTMEVASGTRKDTTIFSLKQIDDGWLVVASSKYRPTVSLFIYILILLITAFLWIIPIVFYATDKKDVVEAIDASLKRMQKEFDVPFTIAPALNTTESNIDKLEKLVGLKEKGVLTEDEFNLQKNILLNS